MIDIVATYGHVTALTEVKFGMRTSKPLMPGTGPAGSVIETLGVMIVFVDKEISSSAIITLSIVFGLNRIFLAGPWVSKSRPNAAELDRIFPRLGEALLEEVTSISTSAVSLVALKPVVAAALLLELV